MKLLTAAIKKKLPKLYATEDVPLGEKIAVAKFFTPDSNWSWFLLEGQEVELDDFLMFGVVEGFETELGYFSLKELESVRGSFGLPIERDAWFSSCKVKDLPCASKLYLEDAVA